MQDQVRLAMRILIVNPNGDAKMTAVIRKAAEAYADGVFQAVCMATPGAPAFIDSYQDELAAGFSI
jgi:Asp/Glu/hydantoin racemase